MKMQEPTLKNTVKNDKPYITALLLCLLFACTESTTTDKPVETGNTDPSQQKQLKTSAPAAIGYEILVMEDKSGIGIGPVGEKALNQLIDYILARVPAKENYTATEAERLLQAVGNAIKEYGISYSKDVTVFGNALQRREFNCYEYTFTYLTVGNNLNLPLSAAIAPRHVFIIWNDSQNEIWWETTGNFKSSKQYYTEEFNLTPQIISDCSFLTALDSVKLQGFIYQRLGLRFNDTKNFKRAIEYYNKAAQHYPNDPTTYTNRSASKAETGDHQGAIADAEQAIRLNPNYAKAYYNRGLSNNNLDNYAGAMDDFNTAIRLDPQLAEAYGAKGDLKMFQDNYEGALEELNQAIKLKPTFAKAYYSRGIVHSTLENFKKSLKDLDYAIANGFPSAFAYHYRGIVKTKLLDFPGAIKDYDKAIELDPNYAESYFNRGIAKILQKDGSGCTDLKTAIRLGHLQAEAIKAQYCR